MRGSRQRSAQALAAGMLTAVALAGCGGGEHGGSAARSITTITAATGSNGANPSGASASSPAASTPAAGSTAAAASPSLPSGAFPGAGGPAPADAVELTETHGSYLVSTPLRISGCEFSDRAAFCTTTGQTAPPPDPSVDGGFLSVNLAKSPLSTEGYGTAAPEWTMFGTVLNYGKTARWKNYVCGSAQNGLTCWNTDTHHGALINRSGITLF